MSIDAPHVDEVLAAMGASEALEGISPAEIRSLLGEIRVYTLTNAKLLFAASRSAGWAHTDPEILEAAGDVSANFPWALMTTVASKLDGLEQRLSSSGAAFLEVGAGVAVMAVEMARLWPTLRVVGIDPWAPALAIARERVRVAGLDARIELRGQRGADLPDVDIVVLRLGLDRERVRARTSDPASSPAGPPCAAARRLAALPDA